MVTINQQGIKMEIQRLREFIRSLPRKERRQFAKDMGSSIGYIEKIMYTDCGVGYPFVMRLEIVTNGLFRCEEFYPNAPWQELAEKRAA